MTKKGKTLDALLETVREAQAPVEPAQPWQARFEQMRRAMYDIAQRFMALTHLVEEALVEKDHERFGYVDPAPFFEEKLQISWYTVQRYLKIVGAVKCLPEGERAQAEATLAQLGVQKASVLAPMIKAHPTLAQLEPWIEEAHVATEEALQEHVSKELGLAPRGTASNLLPGERFYRFLMTQVPPEERPFVEKLFRIIMQQGETHNYMAALLWIFRSAANDLAAQGHPVEVDEVA